MRRTARILLRAAAMLFAVFLLLGFVPTRGLAVEHVREDRMVNCGSFFIRNGWTSDAGCEKSRLERLAWMGGSLGLALLAAFVAVILLTVSHDLERLSEPRVGDRPARLA